MSVATDGWEGDLRLAVVRNVDLLVDGERPASSAGLAGVSRADLVAVRCVVLESSELRSGDLGRRR